MAYPRNAPAPASTDSIDDVAAGQLLAIVQRVEAINTIIDAKQKAQRALIGEIDNAAWPNGYRGKDGRALLGPNARFLRWVSQDVDSGCWNWSGSKTKSGYGLFSFKGKYRLAHRYIVEQVNGRTISEGMVIDHLCRNTSCVNPSHLEIVTPSINVLRGNSGASVVARQKAKTHCPHGHPYSGDNLYVFGPGYRACRACADRRRAEYVVRKKVMQ